MAIVQGVFAGIRGKVGNVIYQVNKGVQVLKQMAYPENPQSTSQTTFRTCFASVVSAFKSLAQNWINIFWGPFLSGNEQAWGKFIGTNLDHMAGSFDGADAILSEGSLENVTDLAATYDTATGTVVVTWDGTVFVNGSASDIANCAVYDSDTKQIVGYSFSSDIRDDEETTFNIAPGYTATNLTLYLTLSDVDVNSSDPTIISDSQKVTCSAPA